MPNFIKNGKRFVSHKEIIEAKKNPIEEPKKEVNLPPEPLAPEARAALEAEYIELFGKNPHPQIGDAKLQLKVDEKKAILDSIKEKDTLIKEGSEDTSSTDGEGNNGDKA